MDKRLGTHLHLWGFFQFTHIKAPNPSPPVPHTNNVGLVYPEFFGVSILYRLGSEKAAEKIWKGCTFFIRHQEITEKHEYCITLPRTFWSPSMYSTCSSFQGTPRRKKKVVHKTATTDDKKLQNVLKKLSVNPIPGIEEVMLICKCKIKMHVLCKCATVPKSFKLVPTNHHYMYVLLRAFLP